jgi:hypothetical protein
MKLGLMYPRDPILTEQLEALNHIPKLSKTMVLALTYSSATEIRNWTKNPVGLSAISPFQPGSARLQVLPGPECDGLRAAH